MGGGMNSVVRYSSRAVFVLSVLSVPLGSLSCGARSGPLEDRPVDASTDGAATGPNEEAPWPMLGQGREHRSRSPFATKDSSHRSWQVALDGLLRSSCVIAKDGTIYAATQDRLYALSPTGHIIWTASVVAENAAPAIGADGTVYVANAGSGIVGLDAFAPGGERKWETAIQGSPELQHLTSPTIGSDGTIFFGTMSGPLTAVSPDGAIRWTAGDPLGRYSSPAIASDGSLFTMQLSSYDSRLDSFAPDGSHTLGALVGASYGYADYPIVGAGGVLYVPLARGLVAMTQTGTDLWAQSREDEFNSSMPAVGADGTVYVSLGPDVVSVVSAVRPDGSIQWSYVESTSDYGGPVALAADGTIYVGGNKVRMVSPQGTLLRTFDVGSPTTSSLALDADGTVIFGAEDGNLYAR
jgi:outer membrane protein assembly factor BamB